VSGTELEQILSLLQRVLPDPSGFAERLVEQALGWVAEQSRTGEAVTGAPHRDRDDRTIVVEPEPSRQAPPEFNELLAAALGACECWGDDTSCRRCSGHGGSGWLEPDADLFQMFVGPAVERLSTTHGRGVVPTTSARSRPRRPVPTNAGQTR
jgi:hypothetical protein